ncbi:MAG: hypothetical protein AAGB29_03025 [Planctomycetota bacterium]
MGHRVAQRRGTFRTPKPAVSHPRLGRWLCVALSLAAALSPFLALGCTAPPVKPDLYDRAAVEKVPGIVDADDDRRLDDRELSELVRSLDHPDPAVRFFAHRTLQDVTGEDFGYVYYRDPRERRAAADRWRAWYNARQTDPAQTVGTAPDAALTDAATPAAVTPPE